MLGNNGSGGEKIGFFRSTLSVGFVPWNHLPWFEWGRNRSPKPRRKAF